MTDVDTITPFQTAGGTAVADSLSLRWVSEETFLFAYRPPQLPFVPDLGIDDVGDDDRREELLERLVQRSRSANGFDRDRLLRIDEEAWGSND